MTAFKSQSVIDANAHKGINALESVTLKPLVLTGKSLTNSQPLHTAVVDGAGSQITAFRNPTIFIDYDDFKQTNPDANGNYQTITLKSSGLPAYTLTLVYDPGGTVTSIVRT